MGYTPVWPSVQRCLYDLAPGDAVVLDTPGEAGGAYGPGFGVPSQENPEKMEEDPETRVLPDL